MEAVTRREETTPTVEGLAVTLTYRKGGALQVEHVKLIGQKPGGHEGRHHPS